MIKIVKYSSKEEKTVSSTIMVDNEDLLGVYSWNNAIKQIELLNSLNYKGYSDWRLPTKEELNELYLNKDIIDGFSNVNYWSSSEYNASYAWKQSFNNGRQLINGKNYPSYVRCVRSI